MSAKRESIEYIYDSMKEIERVFGHGNKEN